MRGDLDARRAVREMRRAIVAISGERERTPVARERADATAAGPSAAPDDARVGFLLNVDQLNVGQLGSG